MKTIAFFNNKGGVGKTTLVHHLAWTFSDLGVRVLAVDLDPQSNLTSMFLDERHLEKIWPDNDEHPRTVLGAVMPIMRGLGDIAEQPIELIDEHLGLLAGDLGLSRFEDDLSQQWPRCLDRKEDAFRVSTAFYRIILDAAKRHQADVVLIDVGPNLGAINRSSLLAANHVVIPLVPDLFSLQGLRNLGPSLGTWRHEWRDRLERAPKGLPAPKGEMKPAGYVALQHNVRLNRPVSAYEKWMVRIPREYERSVLQIKNPSGVALEQDPNCLAQLRHYRSLMPMAMEARKPIFHLRAADGALGAHGTAARRCGEDFRKLAAAIARSCDFAMPTEL